MMMNRYRVGNSDIGKAKEREEPIGMRLHGYTLTLYVGPITLPLCLGQ